MASLALVLLLLQVDAQIQVDEALRRFQAAAEVEQATAALLSQLEALGVAAATPIARRLAEDLRDGMASAFAPALLEALEGRPDALVPLQVAFRDAATPAAGRLELAQALSHLHDATTWRDGVASIARDARLEVGDRLRALEVLLPADPAGALEELRRIVDDLPALPLADRRRVVEFLRGRPETFDLLVLAQASLRPAGAVDAPRATLAEVALRPDDPPAGRPPRRARKEEESKGRTGTIFLGAAAVVLLAVLLAIQRKG